MNELASPFTGLGQRARREPSESLVVPQEGDSKAARMRCALRDNGPLTAAQLCNLAGLLNSGFVSALFKGDLASGRVRFVQGCYELNDEYDEALADEIAQAIRLLKRYGYSVTRSAR